MWTDYTALYSVKAVVYSGVGSNPTGVIFFADLRHALSLRMECSWDIWTWILGLSLALVFFRFFCLSFLRLFSFWCFWSNCIIFRSTVFSPICLCCRYVTCASYVPPCFVLAMSTFCIWVSYLLFYVDNLQKHFSDHHPQEVRPPTFEHSVASNGEAALQEIEVDQKPIHRFRYDTKVVWIRGYHQPASFGRVVP